MHLGSHQKRKQKLFHSNLCCFVLVLADLCQAPHVVYFVRNSCNTTAKLNFVANIDLVRRRFAMFGIFAVVHDGFACFQKRPHSAVFLGWLGGELDGRGMVPDRSTTQTAERWLCHVRFPTLCCSGVWAFGCLTFSIRKVDRSHSAVNLAVVSLQALSARDASPTCKSMR